MLDHDCVVVPQVGGFVTCNVPARYVEEESLFLPPVRTVGFNERLKADDGLLVHSYVEAYHCSGAEAKAMLGEQIRDLQQELWETGTYDLGSIGTLTLDERNNVEFSPCQAGTVCPAYYGLDALLFEPLQAGKTGMLPANGFSSMSAQGETPGTGRADIIKASRARGEITISLKKSWLRNIAAVAAAALLFFLVSPDAMNTGDVSGNRAEFTRLMWMPTAQENGIGTPGKPEATQAKDEETGARQPVASAVKGGNSQEVGVATAEGYCVVVASAISEKNAKRLVERLHKEGYGKAQVYKHRNMVRVVFPGFASEAEARAEKKALSGKSEQFASAWIYHIK